MDPNKTDEQEFADQNDGLTDEERAALEGAEDQGALPIAAHEREFPDAALDPEAARAAAAAGDDTGDEGDDGDGNGGDGGRDDGAPAAAAEAEPPPSRPLLVAEVPEGADERLAAIGTEKEQLLEKLDEGDITTREYHAQLEALNAEQRQLEFAKHDAGLAEKLERQRLQTEWETTVHSWLGQNKDWQKGADPVRFNALDQRIREIAASEEGAQLTNVEILDRARDDLIKAFGAPGKGTSPPPPPPPSPGKQRADLPPTLARVPAAEITGGEGEFAVLDRLANTDPLGYEAALAKMTDEQRDRYMRAG